MKTFRDYSKDEQMEWAKKFQSFVTNKLALVKAGGEFDKDLFLEGMAIVEPWPCSIYFIQDANLYKDYYARVPLLHQIFRQVQVDAKDVIREYSDMVASAADVLKESKVGRPNKEEVKAMETLGIPRPKNKREERVVVDKEMKNRITSGQLGIWGETEADASETETPETGATENGNSDASNNRCIEKTELPKSLRDIAWLLSADLAARIDTVAALRGEAATNAEMAKRIAAKGGKQSEIEEYAQASAEKTQEYLDIYYAVDVELATLFIANRLFANYHNIETMAHEKGISTAYLMGKVLMPYYDKLKKENAEFAEFEAKTVMRIQQEVAPTVDENGDELMSSSEKSKLRQRARSYFNNMAKRDTFTDDQMHRMEEYVLQLKENGIEYKDLETRLNSYKEKK